MQIFPNFQHNLHSSSHMRSQTSFLFPYYNRLNFSTIHTLILIRDVNIVVSNLHTKNKQPVQYFSLRSNFRRNLNFLVSFSFILLGSTLLIQFISELFKMIQKNYQFGIRTMIPHFAIMSSKIIVKLRHLRFIDPAFLFYLSSFFWVHQSRTASLVRSTSQSHQDWTYSTTRTLRRSQYFGSTNLVYSLCAPTPSLQKLWSTNQRAFRSRRRRLHSIRSLCCNP